VAVVVAVSLVLAAGQAEGAVTGYVSSPQTNSADWANAVTTAGGAITDINFDYLTAPLSLTLVSAGNYALTNYEASLDATFAVQGNTPSIKYGTYPTDGGAGTFMQNTGEGLHPASNYMAFPVPTLFSFPGVYTTSITLTFDDPVSAVGFNSIDLCNYANPTPVDPLTITAYDGPNGTGAVLGTAVSYNANFQVGYLYFMGLASDSNDIQSFKVTGGWQSKYVTDAVGFDNFKFARIPEPATLTFLGLGALGMLLKRRGGRR
jgi:hypothetical protein